MYRHYVLVCLALVYAFSYMDRQITAILIEDLKLEFSLSDTQLGLLSGFAFALFYATLGLPIARLADRFNRVKIVSIAVVVWSGMTALTATAGSFAHLLLMRVGVGVGEAGAGPPSHSIISDYYNQKERPIALSIYSMGIIVGALLGLVVGGMVAEHYGWRMAFIAAGVPGVFLALLVFLTVKEPMRGQSDEHHTASAELSFFESFSALWENRVYRYVTAAHVFAVFYGYAISSWLPALFLRQWDVSQGEVGGIVGLIFFAGGIPGLLGGGLLATYLAKRDPRWEAWVPAIAVLCAIPMYLLGLRSESILAASIFFGFGTFFFQFSHGPGMAVIQSSVAPNRRAFAAAVMFFASNMLGLGLGPFLVGMISDWRLADSDGGALAVALALTSFSLVFATVGYWYGGVLWGKVSQNAPVRKPSS